MNDITQSTAELLRARSVVPLLQPLDVACIFAIDKLKPEAAEIPESGAERLRHLGIAELGKPFARNGHRGYTAKLSPLGHTVVDVLVLEGREVPGVGVVKRIGHFLTVCGGRIVATSVGAVWRSDPRISTEEACAVIDMFPELRWA